jgi:hypothetical protein
MSGARYRDAIARRSQVKGRYRTALCVSAVRPERTNQPGMATMRMKPRTGATVKHAPPVPSPRPLPGADTAKAAPTGDDAGYVI